MEVDEEPIYFRIVGEEFSSVEANSVEQNGEQVVIVLNYLDFFFVRTCQIGYP